MMCGLKGDEEKPLNFLSDEEMNVDALNQDLEEARILYMRI